MFFLYEETEHRLETIAEEIVLHLFHHLTTVFLFCDKGRIDQQFARSFLMLYESLLCQDFQEGGDGRVGRLWFWIMLQNVFKISDSLTFIISNSAAIISN